MRGYKHKSKDTILGLLKFVKEEQFANDILDGKLYCNNVKFFLDIETPKIGDALDSASIIKKIGNTTLGIQDASTAYSHIFCSTLVSPLFITELPKYQRNVKQSLKDMGNTCIVINNFNEFLLRIRHNYPDVIAKFVWYYGIEESSVSYVPYQPGFNKKNELSFENEFRFFFPFHQENYPPDKTDFSDIDEHKVMEIGSIRDIAVCHDTETVLKDMGMSLFLPEGSLPKKDFIPNILPPRGNSNTKRQALPNLEPRPRKGK